jgi:hypothetical protein
MACTQQSQIQAQDKEFLTITSYVLSVFNNYFGNVSSASTKSIAKNKLFSNNGLMPHSPTRKTDAYITTQTVTAPITMAGSDTHEDDDCCWDYLSKSDSSTSSSGSTLSSISNHSSSSSRQSRSVTSLSGILCEHYVQKTLNSNSNSNSEDIVDVPLETYKVFEASRRRSSSGSTLTLKDDSNTEPEKEEDDDESWFIWDNLRKTKEWIQIVDEELFLPKEKVTTEITIATVEQPTEKDKKARGIRANPAHLRMIVAEVNMMRCNKIVGPLKSRGFLPARTDTFVLKQSSPLKLCISQP